MILFYHQEQICRSHSCVCEIHCRAQLEGCPQVTDVLDSALPCLNSNVWVNLLIKSIDNDFCGTHVVDRQGSVSASSPRKTPVQLTMQLLVRVIATLSFCS
jgi:hypothetical protein